MDLSHNQEITNYIDNVCSQIKYRQIHYDIRLELENHIREIVEEYLEEGLPKKEAVHNALAQMGEAEIVGKQLNQVHKPQLEWSILLLSFLFITGGLIAMYFIQKQSLITTGIPVFTKSLTFSTISLLLILGLFLFDYRKIEKYSLHIYVGTLLLLILTVFWGNQFNGSRCWLPCGPLTINFVAVSPMLFTLALAGLLNNWNWENKIKLFSGIVLLIVPLNIILLAPALASGLIYTVACIILLAVSGARLQKIILMVAPVITLFIVSIITSPYRLQRLLTFFYPVDDPSGSGYLNKQLFNVISDAGFFGRGFTFTPNMLPELHTDFIFAFITYTFGWLASIILISFIIIFLIRIARIARQVKLSYARLLISGFTAILAVEFFWSIFMNLGLAPLSAVGLPFIAYGGSQRVINAAIIGIILSIYRRKNLSHSV